MIHKPEVFAQLNIQVEKVRIEAAGYCRPGPVRAPYDEMPPNYAEASRECGRRWAQLCAKLKACSEGAGYGGVSEQEDYTMSSNGNGATRIPDFLAGMGEDLKQGLFPVRIFNNQEIYDLELRRIFGRSWVYIGHETEIPNPGDFATRYIGEDPFIFIRDQSGTIRVLLNSCRHRGAQVCRVQMGNTKSFVCPFHGWTYANDGTLTGVPAPRQGYRELNMSEWGLFAAPAREKLLRPRLRQSRPERRSLRRVYRPLPLVSRHSVQAVERRDGSDRRTAPLAGRRQLEAGRGEFLR